MKNSWLVFLSVLMTLTTSCGRVPLNYDVPDPVLLKEGPVIACRATADHRTNYGIDAALDIPTATAVDRVLCDEIANSGVAGEVRYLPERLVRSHAELVREGIDVVVEPTLEELAWEVPGYSGMVTTMFFVSLLTGGVGGLFYGATITDVYARVELTVRIIDVDSGMEEIRKYTGSSYEPVEKFCSDTSETKSRLAGKALVPVMEQLKKDVIDFTAYGTPGRSTTGREVR